MSEARAASYNYGNGRNGSVNPMSLFSKCFHIKLLFFYRRTPTGGFSYGESPHTNSYTPDMHTHTGRHTHRHTDNPRGGILSVRGHVKRFSPVDSHLTDLPTKEEHRSFKEGECVGTRVLVCATLAKLCCCCCCCNYKSAMHPPATHIFL